MTITPPAADPRYARARAVVDELTASGLPAASGPDVVFQLGARAMIAAVRLDHQHHDQPAGDHMHGLAVITGELLRRAMTQPAATLSCELSQPVADLVNQARRAFRAEELDVDRAVFSIRRLAGLPVGHPGAATLLHRDADAADGDVVSVDGGVLSQTRAPRPQPRPNLAGLEI